MLTTDLARRFGAIHPIVQAPLAGGGDTPELVAAVCEAGGIGFIGAAYLNAAQIHEASSRVRSLTTRPFGINLFAPVPVADTQPDPGPAVAHAGRYFAEVGLPAPGPPQNSPLPFAEQLDAVLESGAAVFSYTFGLLPEAAMRRLKQRFLVMGTATTVAEARATEAAGADAVIAQGAEAGGHRGTFAAAFEQALIGTLALVPQVVDAVRIPVVASGGIMDGRGIAAALALGASAVQMGTAFLMCHESGVPAAYKDAIAASHEASTRVTRAFSGRPARGIVNRFMTETDDAGADAVLPFPLQNALTRPLRTAAAKQGRAEFLSLWAGQGVRLARRMGASELVAALVTETEAAIDRLAAARR